MVRSLVFSHDLIIEKIRPDDRDQQGRIAARRRHAAQLPLITHTIANNFRESFEGDGQVAARVAMHAQRGGENASIHLVDSLAERPHAGGERQAEVQLARAPLEFRARRIARRLVHHNPTTFTKSASSAKSSPIAS